ncbi:alpha-isopropylmalate synthase regulatory domain-containing protein [Streptomyces sp. NPDC051784]|uniref:alpha-isopropylmalate synthase regulatory domain-containing protein n=1 Tax=Streptomyces sp. NPDC051784 TaxID=3155805 RepID=UPI003415726B
MTPPPGTSTFPTLRTPSGALPADAPVWNPQRPSAMPHHRYRPAHDRVALPLTDRAWPSRRLGRAPLWVPVDLRDGNQALAEPMDTARKRRFFDLLVAMGFKEIEVGYPSASATDLPYLPIDPADIGRTYEEVIRINSQSGKGGVAHLLRTHHGLDLPQAMRPDVSRTVQHLTDGTGSELSAEELWDLFRTTYMAPAREGGLVLETWTSSETAPGLHEFVAELRSGGRAGTYRGTGNGPLSALADALGAAGVTVDILGYSEHATASGPGSPAVAYTECRVDGATAWGAGQDSSVLTASVDAVMAAVNRTGATNR